VLANRFIMQIYRAKAPYSVNAINYYFIKDKNKCLLIKHDINDDYGEHDTSGARLEITIHYQNSYVKKNLEKINIEDVPKRVKDVLTYLS